MNCRIEDMRHKEVINIKDGARLGAVSDLEIDTTNARVSAIVIYGRLRWFGLLGREDDIVIRWQDIQVIGDDTILVNYNSPIRTKGPPRGLGALLGYYK
ncbi:YlmC/YmxH family sporulation protein [Thermocaproicibacter melissae]|uniref:YlmC/YmxH family sporulation protein n=1 Tax=Thermocaproicibacter melissae TaxID=2966552 RepID=UPI0024B12303|nr:YlmC/YmxH family sporulation protein [Thermocaproicibacter melissae]WBY64592.1 YlmC/YmxH family sporulation protein [Thermocaproicibacter melissae]